MKVLFIYPNIGQTKQYHHGIGILSAMLKEKGHQVDLVIMETEKLSFLKERIMLSKPDAICFSVVSNYWAFTKRACDMIKSEFEVPIFCGGMHFTVCPQSIEETSHIDGICIGEGDLALSEVIECMKEGRNYKDVYNFWFRDGDRIVQNPIRPLIDNLNSLPFPDRKIFPDEYILTHPTFLFSRGCPYNCSYCCNDRLKKLYKDKGEKIRFRGVDKAIEEMKLFLQDYENQKIKYAGFDDDSFTKNREWLGEFCDSYASHKSFPPFACNTRPELFDERDAMLLKKAGCFKINLGVETGDETLRRDVLDRHITNEQIIKCFNTAKKYNIRTFSFNMIAFPGETKKAFNETIKLNRIIMPHFMQLTMFYPYPGTRLGDLAREKGYVSSRTAFNYFNDTIMELPGFSRREILWSSVFFRFNVYKFAFPVKAVYCLITDILNFIESRNSFLKKGISIVRFLLRKLR